MKTINTVQDIKTIDIQTLTWFDRVNGNTYFAQEITLNFGMETEITVFNEYQYGYSSFDYEAFKAIKNHFNLDTKTSIFDIIDRDNVIIRSSIKKALKRELKALSK